MSKGLNMRINFDLITVATWLSSLMLSRTTQVYAFDNSNFKGDYAFQLVGPSSFEQANQPNTVATGVMFADGKGHIAGHGTFRTGGIACIIHISGGYVVASDGIGWISTIGSTSTPGCFTNVLDLELVLSNNGQTLDVANNENDYMSGQLVRQTKNKFTIADLVGKYAYRLQGPSSVVRTFEPLTVGVGTFTFDGHGNTAGKGMLRSYGVTCRGTFVGNYKIDSDGTGLINTNFITNTPGCFSSVVDLSLALESDNTAVVANYENDMMWGSVRRLKFK
jgi:hypothetical protein